MRRSIPSLDKGVSHFRCTLPTPPYTHINIFLLQHDKVDEVVHTTEKSTHLRLFKAVQAKLIPRKLLSDIIIPHRRTINTEILCWMVYPKAQQDGLQLTPGLISNDPEIGTAMTQINVHIRNKCTLIPCMFNPLNMQEIDRVVTGEAKQKWRFCEVLIHCVISCKVAEFTQR